MVTWLKNHWPSLVALLFGVFMLYYGYGCESRTQSLNHEGKQVTRQELQMELKTIVSLAEIRNLDLDKQDRIRTIILDNALILIEGNQVNPFGILTGILGLYGFSQGTKNVTEVVKKTVKKRKVNNG